MRLLDEEKNKQITASFPIPSVNIAAFVLLAVILLFFSLPGSANAAFGIEPGSFHTKALNENGTIDTQAGSHPYEYIVSFKFNLDSGHHLEGNPRDIDVELPPGLVGNPSAVPRCSTQEFEGLEPRCSGNTQIGILRVDFEGSSSEFPLYSLVPPRGVPLTLAASIFDLDTFENSSVRSGSDYGVDVDTNNITVSGVLGIEEITWGVPASESHYSERLCPPPSTGGLFVVGCASGAIPKPFLTLPTSCGNPLEADIRVDSEEAPGELLPPQSAFSTNGGLQPEPLTGCERLRFEPSLKLAPDTADADTPAGLTAEVHIGQGGLESIEGVSAANIKNTTVTLPAGVAINPGQAAGLQACGPTEDGLTTQAEKEKGEEDTGPAHCPNASKVGTVQIKTPLLEEELAGDVYILPSNPPNLEILVAANDPHDGIYVKVVGDVTLCKSAGEDPLNASGEPVPGVSCQAPGQLVTTFEKTPELPYTSFKLAFSGGAQAALATPTQCGVYAANADFTPWSSPFTPDLLSSPSFEITNGPNGGPCPSNPLPFSPSLTAGATTDQAGGYTDFSLLLTRPDGQQRIAGLQFKAPEGLTGFWSKVPLCTNAQAEAPPTPAEPSRCPAASQIGHAVVESGPGPYPLVVPEPGQPPAPIYLTEAYDGAPFGLSIVVPLRVGPFTLPTQKVRARIEVNPTTSALTVTTNPFPQEVAGVPTDLREIDAVIERPEFMVNPTNCSPQEFSGTAYGTAPPGQSEPNTSAAISSHFQVGSCRALEFKPKFSVSTSGKTSRADGANLTAKVSEPNVPQGTDSDIGEVKVELPEELPSRLTTLQKACAAAQFESNPAGCPAASKIGYAVVHTPLIPVPLEGPAIFVSHGGEAFPSLTIVLQGDGVTVDLVGATFISKAGITSTTFKTVPDDPFSTFELTLPEGPYSALAALGNLCAPTTTKTVKKRVTVKVHGHSKTLTRKVTETTAGSLVMPTEFVAQNGAVIKQATHISVTGCPKAAKTAKKKRP